MLWWDYSEFYNYYCASFVTGFSVSFFLFNKWSDSEIPFKLFQRNFHTHANDSCNLESDLSQNTTSQNKWEHYAAVKCSVCRGGHHLLTVSSRISPQGWYCTAERQSSWSGPLPYHQPGRQSLGPEYLQPGDTRSHKTNRRPLLLK